MGVFSYPRNNSFLDIEKYSGYLTPYFSISDFAGYRKI